MKLELTNSNTNSSDGGMSNHSDFSADDSSQHSQMSTADFMVSMANGQLIGINSFISLEGLNSGVPTRTTPTLTPTTLRSIEQTFIELQPKPESHENEAGFVPPLVHSIGNNQYISVSESENYTIVANNTNKSNTIWNSSLSQCSSDSNTSPSPADLGKNMMPSLNNMTFNGNLQHGQPQQTRRNVGGRKPNKDANISPEEEERRRIRRERNKAAAARCRKRRVDHTNQLIEETEGLERKKLQLQAELQEIQAVREELEYLLEEHKATCRLQLTSASHHERSAPSPQDVKPYILPGTYPAVSDASPAMARIKTETEPCAPIVDDDVFSIPSPAKKVMLSSTVPIMKPNRPNSLNVNNTDLPGIAISTPSTGIQFNFDSLMVGGTGLTPVSMPLVPNNCSTQQRIPVSMAESPESSSKLVSL